MFQKAIRKQAKLRLALAGPSGSGKTYTALRIAHALAPGGVIAVVDTERGSASLYAGHTDPDDGVRFDFLVSEQDDYSPAAFVRTIQEAARAKVDVLILDSITHAWDGVKDLADQGAKRKAGNTWAGWSDARPAEKAMLDAMLQFPGHVIATMRVKTEWEIVEERGKKTPRKVGLKPEQKAGIEYEFTVFGDLDYEHTMIVSKSRCYAIADKVIQRPGRQLAEVLLAWLNEGEAAPPPPREQQRAQPPTTPPAPTWPSDEDRLHFTEQLDGCTMAEVEAVCAAQKWPHPAAMTAEKRAGLLTWLGTEKGIAAVQGVRS